MVDLKNKRCLQPGCTKEPSFGVDGSNKREFCSEHKIRSRDGEARVPMRRGEAAVLKQAKVVGLSKVVTTRPPPSLPIPQSRGRRLRSPPAFSLLPPSLFAQGGATAYRGVDGRSKRKGRRPSFPTADSNTGAGSSSGSRSNKTNSRGERAKRARRSGDDDMVVLEADDQPGGASGSAASFGAAVLRPGAKVAVKAEH